MQMKIVNVNSLVWLCFVKIFVTKYCYRGVGIRRFLIKRVISKGGVLILLLVCMSLG